MHVRQLALLTTIAAALALQSQAQPVPANPTATLSLSINSEFVVINYGLLFSRSKFGVRMADELRDARLALKMESDFYSREFEREELELAESRSSLPRDEFEILVEDFDRRVMERRTIQDGKEVQLVRWEGEQRRLFNNSTLNLIAQLARLHGAKTVIPSEFVVWYDEQVDLTPLTLEVVDRIVGTGVNLEDYSEAVAFAGISADFQ